jgi:hypothetical protein
LAPLSGLKGRAYDFWKAMARWGLIFWRYYRMMKRIKRDPAAMSYSDEQCACGPRPTKPTKSSNCLPTFSFWPGL